MGKEHESKECYVFAWDTSKATMHAKTAFYYCETE